MRLRKQGCHVRMQCYVPKRPVALWVIAAMGAGPVAVGRLHSWPEEQHNASQATACRVLQVSFAWFYKWPHGNVPLGIARRDIKVR